MNIEARLTERIGEAGRRLHTARSRNDQVAVDFRLWVRDAIDGLSRADHRRDARARRPCRDPCRRPDAGLHSSADGAAGDVRSSSAGVRRDAGSRPRPACRLPPPAERVPAGQRGAGRDLVSHRSRDDRARRWGSTGRPPIRSMRYPTATLPWSSSPRRRSRRCTCRASPRRSSSGVRRPGASSGCPTHSPPAARSCRRSAIRMQPNWCAPRPDGSPERCCAADRHEGPAARLRQGHAGGQGAGVRRTEAWALSLAAIAGWSAT